MACSAKRSVVGSLVVLVGFASWLAAPVLAARPAAADTVGNLQSQIAATEGQVTAAAVRIHTLAARYDQASLAASNFAQQVAVDSARVSALKQQVGADQTALRQEAVLAYMGGTATDLTPSAQAASTDPSVRAEYLQIASGGVSDVVDQYQLQQRELQSAEAVVAQQEEQAKAQAAAADQARKAALAAATAAQTQLNQLQAQLIQAQQAAAAEAAAQAAAAQAAAAQAAATARQAATQRAVTQPASAARQTTVPRAAPSATQGAPVNNGLVSAVQTLVSPPAPANAPAPARAPVTPAPPPATGGGGAGGVWLALRECESSNNYAENTGNGFFGAYQFSQATWTGLGYPGRPDLAPPAMQDTAAQKLQAESGWGQWPACSAALGLR